MRLDQLTFTRFLAAFAILVFHYGQNVYPFNTAWLAPIFGHANAGVSYFFTLSGFVMVIAYWNKGSLNFWDYMRNRVARIYPVYLLAILLLLGYFILKQRPIPSRDVLLNLLMIQAWLPGHSLSFNTPAWSISVELLFYLMFPLLMNYMYTKFSFQKLILPIFLFWLISQALLIYGLYAGFGERFTVRGNDLLFYFPLMHLNEFLVGNLAGLFFITKLQHKKGNFDLAVLSIIFSLGAILFFVSSLYVHNGLLAPLFVILILLMAVNSGYITRVLNHPWLIFLGEISYGIYILQIPVMLSCQENLEQYSDAKEAFSFYVPVLILIGVSALSYVWIEAPLRSRIKQLRFSRLGSDRT